MKTPIFFMALVISLVLSSGNVGAKRKTSQYFKQKSFDIDFILTHPVYSGEFVIRPPQENNQSAELLLVGEDQNQQLIFSLFGIEKTSGEYKEISRFPIANSFIAFDLLSLSSGQEQIVLLDEKGLSLLDIVAKKISRLTETSSIYLQPKSNFISKKNMVSDLNGDGLQDIAISDFKQRHVLLQNKLGEFERTSLPIKSVVDMTNQDITFSTRPVFNQDTNFDGRKDIFYLEDNHLVIFNQNSDKGFLAEPKKIQLPFEIAAVPWWKIRGSDGEQLDQSNLEYRMIEFVEDINGDGILDIMARKTLSQGVLDRQNIYEIYYGENMDGLLGFKKEPATQISAEGTLSGLKLFDTNGDGLKEILVSSFDIGVSQIIGALMSGSIDQDVYVFALDKGFLYQKEPLFSEEVDLNFSLSSGQTGQPVVLTCDINGDGYKDVMLSSGEKRLSIFAGEATDSLFQSRRLKHKIQLPKDGSMITAADLNGDKKDEIIVRYGKQDDEKLKHKIIILSAG